MQQLRHFYISVSAGCTIADAVQMLTAVPARILNLPKGRLEAGLDGDVVVFDDNIQIAAVFAAGIQRV